MSPNYTEFNFIKRFVLNRREDVSGSSGVGVVASGVQFKDGVCVLRWNTKHRCTGVYENIEDIISIHGHGGRTQVLWID